MVIQCQIDEHACEFASEYASQTSTHRADMCAQIKNFQWSSHAFLCGDFNNSPRERDNTTHKSRMLPSELNNWNDMSATLGVHA